MSDTDIVERSVDIADVDLAGLRDYRAFDIAFREIVKRLNGAINKMILECNEDYYTYRVVALSIEYDNAAATHNPDRSVGSFKCKMKKEEIT